ncbi:DUF3298 and DUF4163 domain-containing protein [Acetivibrio cellulolyticus]|uniref:DUF3298 and DUF4163 domain-containing protein n=1 Tax=Acetivibrio cellulolyticus TaxID=35830 RepID=UPI0001E2EBFF|nr:DUF3298 and DUF4163 domain-containing protein [Acetivibrio cellulolyticus]
MKRLVVALLLLTFVFSGCSGAKQGNKGAEGTPAPAPLVIDESKLNNDYVIEEIKEDNTKEGLESIIKYPKVSNMCDKALEERVNGAFKARIDKYKEVASMMGDVAGDTASGASDVKIQQVLNVSYEVAFRSKYTLSIKLILENYVVNLEEPDEYFEAINFNLRNGTQFELADLVKNKDKLTPLLTKKVKESGKALQKEITALEDNQGFYIKENGLVLYFQTIPYTTANVGPLEFEIPYDEIKDMVKDQKIWEKEPASTSMNEYNNTINEKTRPLEALSFIDGKVKNVNKEEATTMILSFEEIQSRYLSIYEDSLMEESVQSELSKTFEYNFDRNKIGDIKDEKVRSLVKEILDGGYSIVSDEGSYTPIQNYQVLEKYTGNLQDEVKEYIVYKAAESKRMNEMGNGGSTSWSELAQSIITIENYLGKYPNSIKESEMTSDYQYYFHAYLFGFDNSPAFSYETNKIDEKLLNSYRQFVADNKTSETAKILEQYVAIIEKNNNTLCEEIENYRKAITEDPDVSQ